MCHRLVESARASSWRERVKSVELTPRELQVVSLVADGLSNKQIARRLFSLSLYTVKNHVHNVVEKLQVENRFKPVEYARPRGCLEKLKVMDSGVARELPLPCSDRPLIPYSSRELGSSPCPFGSLTGGRDASLWVPWGSRFPTMLPTHCVKPAKHLSGEQIDKSPLFARLCANKRRASLRVFRAGGIRRRPADAHWASTAVCSQCINPALSPHSPNRLRSACVSRSVDSYRAQAKRGASFSDRRFGKTQPRPAARNKRGIAQSTPNYRSGR